MNLEQETVMMVSATKMEHDLAQSAWHDARFALWFSQFACSEVLFNGAQGQAFFAECGAFAKKHKQGMGEVGDDPMNMLNSKLAKQFFKQVKFVSLPGGKTHKPTTWQIEKARKYLSSRNNILLSQRLEEAEQVRADGDSERADILAMDARKVFAEFKDNSAPCRRALDDEDAILKLAEYTPSLFYLDGELGRMLNPRLKGDNFGMILANQKIGKTTTLLDLAIESAKYVPTLFISAGDETELKINARIATHRSCCATQREFAGTYAMPVPDCAHNANGTCPIAMGGEPRVEKDWRKLMEAGATPEQCVDGDFDGSRTINGNLYQPCCRCFPLNNNTPKDRENRKRWKSAIWWRKEDFPLINKKTLKTAKREFNRECSQGGLWIAEYSAGTLTPDMIEEKLDSIERNYGVVIEHFVLDYFDLCKQPIFRSSDKDHDGMRMNYEAIRSITFRRGILGTSSTQTNRNELETHTINTIGRCAKGADNATWFLTLNQTILERRAKVMRASMLFAREGGFDPEHQALCCQWLAAQDAFAFSMPIFCKTKKSQNQKD